MKRITPLIPSSLETCVPPLEGMYVCTPANHVARGRAHPVRASNGGRARMHPSAGHSPLPWSPLGRMRSRLHRRRLRPCEPHKAFTPPPPPRSRPPRRSSPMRRAHPWKPFAPYRVRTLPRARLLSISSSKLFFIQPLGHPGLQLLEVDDCWVFGW
jgi:hypothetical protein